VHSCYCFAVWQV